MIWYIKRSVYVDDMIFQNLDGRRSFADFEEGLWEIEEVSVKVECNKMNVRG
jgi:hypothetical protein